MRSLLWRWQSPVHIRWRSILAWAGVAFLFFRGSFFAGGLPLFRDGANLYYPLWRYVREQYLHGRWPFWNPYLVFGAPLASEGIAAAFYPGILLFLLPIPYPWAYLLFLLAHLALAGWGTYRLARRLGVSHGAGFLASLAYSFSGYVLFQIYNPIYLVSGAWLPFVLSCLWRLLRTPPKNALAGTVDGKSGAPAGRGPADSDTSRRGALWDVVECGVYLALMVLGGDPQTAYHCVLIGGLIAIGQVIWEFSRHVASDRAGLRSALFFTGRNLARLGLVSLAAFGLAAVQIIPTAVYIPRTERYLLATAKAEEKESQAVPRILPLSLSSGNDTCPPQARPWWKQVAELERQRYQKIVYDFSTPLYRWLELVWPNFGGRPLPYHTRWLGAFVEEGRWWVPSLYMGFFTVALALFAMKFWPNRRPGLARQAGDATGPHVGQKRAAAGYGQRRPGDGPPESQPFDAARIALTWMALVSGLAALGWYGPAGMLTEILKQITRVEASCETPAPPVGGLYWLLLQILPRYALFRYPSKWLIFASLAIACLAGIGLDRLLRRDPAKAGRVIRRVLMAMAAIAVLSSSLAALLTFENGRWLRFAVDPLFGPFRHDFAILELLVGGASLGGLAVVTGVAFRYVPRNHWSAVIVAFTAVDLLAHNGWMVFAVRPPTKDAGLCVGRPPQRHWITWCHYPEEWERTSSARRLQEICDWEYRHSLFGWSMLSARSPLENYGTLMPAEAWVLLGLLRGWLNRHDRTEPPEAWLELLGVAAKTSSEENEGIRRSWSAPARGPEHLQICSGLFFVAHRWQEAPTSTAHREDLWEKLAELFFPSGMPRDRVEAVMVEGRKGDRLPRLPVSSLAESSVGETGGISEGCRLEDYHPGEATLCVQLAQPAVVVLREQHLPGWRVTVSTPAGDVSFKGEPLRVDGLFLGVHLPPGNWRVRFQYTPPGWPNGAGISVAAWIVLLLGALLHRLSVARCFRTPGPREG